MANLKNRIEKLEVELLPSPEQVILVTWPDKPNVSVSGREFKDIEEAKAAIKSEQATLNL